MICLVEKEAFKTRALSVQCVFALGSCRLLSCGS